jgi:dolichyl-phosphate mannosyltransferase polypeptide 3
MSRGTRFLTLAIPISLVYLLMLAGILPVPFLSTEITDQILPAVSPNLHRS